MFDLKVIHAVLTEMEEERGIKREKMIDAIEQSLATAYKKEFGKRGQIITANFDLATGDVIFNQVKIVVDESMLKPIAEEGEEEVVARKWYRLVTGRTEKKCDFSFPKKLTESFLTGDSSNEASFPAESGVVGAFSKFEFLTEK